ncbi:GNAT family N-acetyltransferase [Weissella confusa]|uniref:GNAT family N-acetyltransferase n=1 Tax=Weissella confusa TaxID=1583 RepID=UPI0018F24E63|nr:GNAT family N-acetyltransferase [Weissella confusa]MBJ7692054.1 GNAT family N-acetyltransferase [Weissella confusa]
MIIRPLEKVDLEFIYQQENTRNAMALWFEEPYSSFDELSLLYDKHILDQSERRFIVQEDDGTPVGVVEIMDIDLLHRTAEIQVYINSAFTGNGYATKAMAYGVRYGFNNLILHKLYLYVDVKNASAIHIYEKLGFRREGTLIEQFFAEGQYHDSYSWGCCITNIAIGLLPKNNAFCPYIPVWAFFY